MPANWNARARALLRCCDRPRLVERGKKKRLRGDRAPRNLYRDSIEISIECQAIFLSAARLKKNREARLQSTSIGIRDRDSQIACLFFFKAARGQARGNGIMELSSALANGADKNDENACLR